MIHGSQFCSVLVRHRLPIGLHSINRWNSPFLSADAKTRSIKTFPIFKSIYIALLFILVSSCSISFQGISISQDVKTFYIAPFETKTLTAPPTLPFTFGEALKDKVLQNTRLTYAEIDPHVSFEGSISKYKVTSVSPQQGQGAELNRLEITIQVEFENIVDEDNWNQSFEFFSDFDRDTNLEDVEDQLIDDIFEQLIEDVFNRAFANW